ncbi:esterase-like activity of phytase family protein [Ferrimonas balearica]|uniref:esterase-like activity of phytase family protein n=1 Tax=Ferrimonas balearica TaxID=44012 RepID=UPI001C9936A1|nr:esterase-like activity of phytase family protein [Ferrimonas balearica]MBY5920515.1 esterase-like activity of phytase family protein [Ferrimonas balearica]MBY5996800.1 esterase-like activity of phytase family protein [Ferrimonas balearica]
MIRPVLKAVVLLLIGLGAKAAPEQNTPTLVTERWHSDFEVLQQQTDRLRYAGTLRLHPPSGLDTHRGAWSALVYLGPHLGFQATSDRNGHWFTFDVKVKEGELIGAHYLDHGQILGPDGKGLENIESMLVAGELILVGLDESPVLYQLDRHRTRARPRFTLASFSPGRNDGIESLAFIEPAGPLLPIAEKARPDSGSPSARQAWRLTPGSDAIPFSLPLAMDLSPVGSTRLPNGDLILLHRHYASGIITIGLSRYDGQELQSDSPIVPQSLLQMRSLMLTQSLDNFEGLAAFEREGRQYLLLISDDNVDWQRPGRQNTLLMLFEWLN